MRVKALLASAALVVAASQGAIHGAFAQGYGQGYGQNFGYNPPAPGFGPPPSPDYVRPSYGGGGGQMCAAENGFCAFRGYATVRYGARGRYVSREARDGIPCNNRVFGDPIYGVPKRCYID